MADQPEPRRATDGAVAAYEFRLFGRFSGRRLADGADVTPRGRKSRALLAYLLLERKPVDRDRLAGLLWSERGQAQAHASLRQCLLELRALSHGPAPLLAVERHQVAATGAAELDIERMAALAAAGDAEGFAAALGEGEALLEDLDGLDPAFDQWLRAVRTSRGDGLINSAEQAWRKAIAAGRPEAALQLARQLQRIDPMDEKAARLAMEAAHAAGQPQAAERLYDVLRKTLRDEAGAEPAAETRALYERLGAPNVPVVPAPPQPPAASAHGEPAPATAETRAVPRRRLLLPSAAAMLLLASAAATVWLRPRTPAVPMVAVVADRAAAGPLSRQLGLDIARLASARPDAFAVIDPSDGTEAEYIVRVGSERLGDVLRADLSLLVRGSAELLWSARFQRPARDQTDLREQMAAKLGSVLLCMGYARRAEVNLGDATRRLFLAACDQLDEPPGEQRRAVLRQLTQRAPRFAWGWAKLAQVEAEMSIPLLRRSAGAMPAEAAELRRAATSHMLRARALDETVGAIYVAEATLIIAPDAWAERLAVTDRGIAADPDDPALHEMRSSMLSAVGRSADAVASARRAVELSPVSAWIRSRLIIALAYSGNISAAWQELATAERLWPGAAALRDARFRLELRYGDPRNALRIIEMDETRGVPGDSSRPFETAYLAARVNPSPANIEAALRPFETLQRQTSLVAPSHLQLLVQFGRVDEAFRVLQGAANLDSVRWGSDVLFRPQMRPLRNDSRFPPLAARLGLLQYWQESGQWPDFCSDPELPYDCRVEAGRLLGGRAGEKGAAR